MNPIADALSRIKLGEPAQFKNMTVFPLFAPSNGAPDYLLLSDALKRKLAHVTEVSESGAVPELLFVNEADEKVLLVDGEELVGAKQNRILNATILVGGKRKVVIPVSCVEQGRWHWKSRRFETSERALFARARAHNMRRVSESLRRTGTYDGNQGEIWHDVHAKAEFLAVASETRAMSDIFEKERGRIDDYVNGFEPVEHQAGAVFAVNGSVVGLELFDSAATFRKFMKKLLRSYALDAIEEPDASTRAPAEEAVHGFIADLKAAAVERFPAVGEGESLRLGSEVIAGGALYADRHIVHHRAPLRIPARKIARPPHRPRRQHRLRHPRLPPPRLPPHMNLSCLA